MISISFIKLKGKITDNYTKTLSGWRNKDVTWEDIHKVINNSNIQYSCYSWNDGVKSGRNFNRTKQNCLVIDIDDGMAIHEFQSMFKKYKYILGTTKSHQKEKKGLVSDRFRVIIPSINIPVDNDVYFRMMELIFPMNDKQTLTKTASFLGQDDCIVIRNDGKLLDCFKASTLAVTQLKEEKALKVAKTIDKDLLDNRGNSIDKLKNDMDYFNIRDIVESLGYEFEGQKFKLREERTPSAKIYPSGFIKDYGGDFQGDIFQLLVEVEGMSFPEAIKYVRRYV